MDRSTILSIIGSLLLSVSALGQQPNFLMIILDDQRTFTDEWWGLVYPDAGERAAAKAITTPNLDTLRSSGVFFPVVYSANPLCQPSRTQFMTGLRNWKVSANVTNGTEWRDEVGWGPNDVTTIGQTLRAAGYYATGIGKVFHGVQRSPGSYDWTDEDYGSWDSFITNGRGPLCTPTPCTPSIYAVGTGELEFGLAPDAVADQNDWKNANFTSELMEFGSATILDTYDDGSKTETPGNHTVTLTEPFYVACGLLAPHVPRYIPASILSQYDIAEMGGLTADLIAANLADLDDCEPDVASRIANFSTLLANGITQSGAGGDVTAWRESVRHYLAATKLADQYVGVILAGLAAGTYADNTIVMVFGDHGYSLGDKYHQAKSLWWEDAQRTSMWIANPEVPSGHGQSCAEPVNLMDLYRTLCDYAGAAPPAYVGGISIANVIADPALIQHRQVYATSLASAYWCFRDSTHAFMSRFQSLDNTTPRTEFYDMIADPFQRTNTTFGTANDTPKAFMWQKHLVNKNLWPGGTSGQPWWNAVPTTGFAGPRSYPE